MAYSKFQVGEIVITQHATYFSEFDGSLGVVIYPLQRRLCLDLNLMERVYSHVYGVQLLVSGEPRLWFRPWQLRKPGSDAKFDAATACRKSPAQRETNVQRVRGPALAIAPAVRCRKPETAL
jgi:hypothetical protein